MTSAAHHSQERRTGRRGRLSVLADPLFKGFRIALGHVHSFRAAVGIFVLAGSAVALGGAAVFAEFAGEVREGDTQAFDERVLGWLGQNRHEAFERLMVEVTMLGTGIVVLVMVGVAAMFLWLSRHRYSAILLLVATAGGIVLNNILKLSFARPRPQVFEWGTHALSSSFPSGHSMSAAIVYGTVAYLAARLQRRRWTRALTMLVALGLILLIGFSRLYLGVHYPSDVAAGLVIGLAWAGFCMATLEIVQRYAERGSPQVVKDELPAPKADAPADAAASP
jgi:undecaprenyl-diphosphatase